MPLLIFRHLGPVWALPGYVATLPTCEAEEGVLMDEDDWEICLPDVEVCEEEEIDVETVPDENIE